MRTHWIEEKFTNGKVSKTKGIQVKIHTNNDTTIEKNTNAYVSMKNNCCSNIVDW